MDLNGRIIERILPEGVFVTNMMPQFRLLTTQINFEDWGLLLDLL